ncbi:MAG: hypothetical protein E5X53_12445 [Mesorhizobium sp.]|uniref:hypothetical protein n=1 Tax=Mesorhizobium sp. TaxID=1871066 RepID=UPI00121F2C32|nr:hypothetical protein [Mesorhizobium sp.]TIP74843.1 MAG: hypothetical protein E5X55_07815 [Mesorhizobium sp.]TIQ14644.1 MAG: hypothetical protein E5X57_04100 [Mesorhizobium sp.]TIR52172.1 MAG: hypothetical protein E5X53_12445 [Mesorhizobium sp.]TJV96272.1 MAG: hypothetical protein E5X52_19675 [Mesorhizobium sp.]
MSVISQMVMSSMAPPSSVTSVEQTDIRSKQGSGSSPNTFASVAFGAPGPRVWSVALLHHFNVTNQATISGITIGGVVASFQLDNTGDGAGGAAGICIARAQPATSSGDVAVTWLTSARPALSLVMLRVVGFDLTTPSDTAELPNGSTQSGAGKTLNIETVADGLLLGGACKRNTNDITWTNLTEQGEDTQGSHTRSWGWDHPTVLQSNRAVSFTSTSSALVSMLLQSFPKY